MSVAMDSAVEFEWSIFPNVVENEEDAKNVEDKIQWAAGIDEPEFRDGLSGRLLDPMKVRSAREEELKELERRVCVQADLECIRVTAKKPIGVRGGVRG